MSADTVLRQSALPLESPSSVPAHGAAGGSPGCPACGIREDGAKQFRVLSARGESAWAKCGECAAYYLIGDYDSAAEAAHTAHMPWGQLQAGVQLNDFKKRMYDATLAGIRMRAPSAKTILDVGCSFGGFLLEARQCGYTGIGVDIVPQAIDYVRKLGFAAEACESMSQCHLVSEKNQVDVLTVLDAHIYWPDQPGELSAAWKLIRPGGLLVMRALTKSHFVSIGRALQPVAPGFSRNLIRRSVIDHRFCMPLRSLLKTITACGFQIESVVPRDAQHSELSSTAVRLLFAIGDLSWKTLGVHLAPGATIYARKPGE
jgi:SAM-dependent methyltransferase